MVSSAKTYYSYCAVLITQLEQLDVCSLHILIFYCDKNCLLNIKILLCSHYHQTSIVKGKIVGSRYKIIEYLAEGGFGRTYLAEDTQLPGRDTCLVKQLHPSRSDPQFLAIARRLFETEASTLHNLGHHRQIPELLAYFEEEEKFYLVQQYIEGATLTKELDLGKKWLESQAIAFLQDAVSILQFVHEKGVIHRDIKPDNIIRRESDDKLVLVDFGSVKQVLQGQQTNLGQLTIAVGTQGYMPTEQARGKPRPTSDIYALGIIAIQALTGIAPLDLPEDDEGEIIWESSAKVSRELSAILTRMTRYHFKDRYKTAKDVLQALDKLPSVATKVQSLTNAQSLVHTSITTTTDVSKPAKFVQLPEPASIVNHGSFSTATKSHRELDATVINSKSTVRSPVKSKNSSISGIAIALILVSVIGVGAYLMMQQSVLELEVDTPATQELEIKPDNSKKRLQQGEGFRKDL